MNQPDKDSFGERLRNALGVKTNREIAKRLGVKPSAVTEYMSEDSYPPAKKLIEIAKETNVSLDWLLLKKGDEPAGPADFLDPAARDVVIAVADIEGRGVEELLADLVRDALDERAADMIRHRRTLRPTELRKLKVLMKLLGGVEDAVETKPNSNRRAR